MSTNVESFESFASDVQIAAHQAGLIRVVLEGRTDMELFSRFWFSSKCDIFDFVEAAQLVGASGCTAVRAAVSRSVDVDGVPAIGVVDRDSLFRERRWELLFEVDEDRFTNDVQTPEIYVASLWEVEAYMLEPDLISPWVSSSHRSPPGSAAECASALTRVLAECQFLLDASSYFAAAHAEGKSVNDAFCRGQSAAAALAVCSAEKAKLSAASQSVGVSVDALVEGVRAGIPAGEAEQLRFLLRYVDTKRLLVRLFEVLKVRDQSQWVLPPMQMIGNRKPVELEAMLGRVEKRYSSNTPQSHSA